MGGCPRAPDAAREREGVEVVRARCADPFFLRSGHSFSRPWVTGNCRGRACSLQAYGAIGAL